MDVWTGRFGLGCNIFIHLVQLVSIIEEIARGDLDKADRKRMNGKKRRRVAVVCRHIITSRGMKPAELVNSSTCE